ncbi:MAG: hypothetical protein ABR538_11840 [Candidatus Binatia bacterium]
MTPLSGNPDGARGWRQPRPRLAASMDPKTMPFDGKRMIYGGFKTFVSA